MFPDGWGRKCKLTIDRTKVNSAATDFPVLCTVDNLPSEMFDADGDYPALNGGGDIRFSSDSGGAIQLPCEIVKFVTDNNPANGLAEIWVKVPTVNAAEIGGGGTDTDFYIWYNKTGETQPARNDAYGLENVWDSDYKAVYHCSDATTSTTLDSTSNLNHITKKAANTPSEIAGKWSAALGQDFDTDEYMSAPDDVSLDGMQKLTLSCWCYANSFRAAGSKYNILINKWISGGTDAAYLGPFIWTSKWGYYLGGASAYGGNLSIGAPAISTWYYINLTYDGSVATNNTYLWQNTTPYGVYSHNLGTLDNCTDLLYIGNFRTLSDYNWDGIIDEVRISAKKRDAWIITEYNNQNDPATFISVGTPTGQYIPKVIIIN
uniref:Putative structural protein n=1 Tax=viral metagenome TaxID=1070528 RepID=A0A6M3L8H0_9ZZZZ